MSTTPRIPSGSALYRANRCPASQVLGQGPDKTGKAAEKGNDIHAFLEAYIKGGQGWREAALAAIGEPATRRACEKLDLSAIPTGAESEIAFGISPATFAAIRYELTEKRRYPWDGFVHLTLDLVGRTDDEVIVIDFKTGRAPVYAEGNLQLRAGALAACRVAGVPRARVAIFTLLDSGEWLQDWATLTEFDIADVEEEIRGILARVNEAAAAVDAGKMPEMEAGAHCRYCRCATGCPLQMGIVRAAFSDLAQPFDRLTPKQIGQAWERKQMLEALLERADDTFMLLVEQLGEIPLPSGQVLKITSNTTTKVDPDAVDYVRKAFGEEVLAAASTVKLDLAKLTTEQKRALEEADLIASIPTKPFLKAMGRRKALPKARAAA